MKKLIKEYLDITNIGVWTGVFLSVIFMDLSTNDLKTIALGATFLIIFDLLHEMLENRTQKIEKDAKRKVMLEYMANGFKYDNKQGEE